MAEKVRKSVTVDSDVAEIIEKAGEIEGRKFSNMVNKILKDFALEWENNHKKS